LIAYYHPFLAGLVAAFEGEDHEEKIATPVVAGFSLGGFEVEDWHEGKDPRASGEGHESLRDLLFPASSAPQSPLPAPASSCERIYTLAEQVELCFARLENLVRRLRWQICKEGVGGRGRDTTRTNDAPVADPAESADVDFKVTLIGHSVGAYIALELVRLRHERRAGDARLQPSSPSPLSHDAATHTKTSTTAAPPPISSTATKRTIASCILLTPTIQDLHLSPSGRIAHPLLTYAPFLPNLAHGLVQNVLVRYLPHAWFEALVQRATGMRMASHGFLATVAFLRSGLGVRQALEMAKCEFREIRRETWGKEVWGAREVCSGDEGGAVMKAPDLYLWFARQDHWVADVTRDEILRRRGQGQENGKTGLDKSDDNLDPGDDPQIGKADTDCGSPSIPRILVDETEGLVHAWCLTQTELVTGRVSGWLKELWEGNGGP